MSIASACSARWSTIVWRTAFGVGSVDESSNAMLHMRGQRALLKPEGV